MKIALLALVAMALTGCETMQTQRRPNANDDPSMACFNNMATNERLAILRPKIAIDLKPEDLPLPMLADTSRPTAAEKEAISAWTATRRACMEIGEPFRAQYAPPEWSAMLRNNTTRLNSLAARLFGGEITYGEFNRQRAENAGVTQATIAQQQQRERDANAAQEQANQQAAGQALINFNNQMQLQREQNLIRQQQLMQQNQPVYTTCNRLGSSVNCISR